MFTFTGWITVQCWPIYTGIYISRLTYLKCTVDCNNYNAVRTYLHNQLQCSADLLTQSVTMQCWANYMCGVDVTQSQCTVTCMDDTFTMLCWPTYADTLAIIYCWSIYTLNFFCWPTYTDTVMMHCSPTQLWCTVDLRTQLIGSTVDLHTQLICPVDLHTRTGYTVTTTTHCWPSYTALRCTVDLHTQLLQCTVDLHTHAQLTCCVDLHAQTVKLLCRPTYTDTVKLLCYNALLTCIHRHS